MSGIETFQTKDQYDAFLDREKENGSYIHHYSTPEGLEINWANTNKPTAYYKKQMENTVKQMNQKHITRSRLLRKLEAKK